MKNFIAIIAMFVSMTSSLAAQDRAVKVFILAGQSNLVGHGKVEFGRNPDYDKNDKSVRQPSHASPSVTLAKERNKPLGPKSDKECIDAEEQSEPIFHFTFDKHLNESLGDSILEAQTRFLNRTPIVEATNPRFAGCGLVVDGETMRKSYVVRTPSLEFDKFTVVSRFRPFRSCSGEFNIVTGGYWLRWLTIFRNKSGLLCVAFNNERLVKELPVTIESGKWYTLVCNVDLNNRIVRTFVNGMTHEFKLPLNFELSPRLAKWAENQYEEKEKHFMFDNRGNGRDCQAVIDEFGVYNGLVDPQVAESCLKVALMARLITGSHRTSAIEKEMHSNEEVKRQITTNLNGAGFPSSDRAFFEYLEGFPSKEKLDQKIGELIRQLEAPKFQKRSLATFRLRLIGLPALAQLNAVEDCFGPEVEYRSRRLLKEMVAGDFISLSIFESSIGDYEQPGNLVPYLFSTLAAAKRDFVRLRICNLLLVAADSSNRDTVQKALKDQDKWVRFAAVLLLERVNGRSDAGGELDRFLTDRNELIRLTASYLVSRQSDWKFQEHIQKFFESSDWKIRSLANRLSRHMASNDP